MIARLNRRNLETKRASEFSPHSAEPVPLFLGLFEKLVPKLRDCLKSRAKAWLSNEVKSFTCFG